VPIRKVARTKQLTAIIEKKDEDFRQSLLHPDRWGLLDAPLLLVKTTAFSTFKKELTRLGGSTSPLRELKFCCEVGEDKYYYSCTEDWWAYYYVDEGRECAVAFLICQKKLSRRELIARLDSVIREYEG